MLSRLSVSSRGTLFAAQPGSDAQSATFPLPCITPGGRWLCAFRAAPQKVSNTGQRVLLTWSDDQGKSWVEPRAPFAPTEVDGAPGLMRFGGVTTLGDGRLIAAVSWVDFSTPEAPYFNEATEGLLDTRIFLSWSGDEGKTWSPLQRMDTTPFNVPAPLTGPILRLPSGELACHFELNKPYTAPEPWKHASVMLFSSDDGQTWPRHTVVTQDPDNRVFYWDQRPSVLPGGRLLDLFWTFDRQEARYLNIHARESLDSGRTWSPLWDTGVPGQPGPAFPLEDGALAMPFVDRTAAPIIKVRQSRDLGRTWPEETELSVFEAQIPAQTTEKASMQDAWSEMYAFSVGLPNVAPCPGGGALLVYYAGSETDQTGIHWALIR